MLLSDFLRHDARPDRHARRLRARRLRRVHRRSSTASPFARASRFAVQADGLRRAHGRGARVGRRCRRRSAATTRCSAASAPPGILVAATDLLARGPRRRASEIVDLLSGHLCRCTGYEPIVDAIVEAAGEREPRALAPRSLRASRRRRRRSPASPTPSCKRASRASPAGSASRRGERVATRARQPRRDGAPLLGGAVGGRRLRPALVAPLRGRARLLHRGRGGAAR